MSQKQHHSAYHTHLMITELKNYGDNKLKSIVTHSDGGAHATRQELQRLQDKGYEYLTIGDCNFKKSDGSCGGHILPIEPQRDAMGYYMHPGIPDFNDDNDALANWIYEQQLTINVQFLFEADKQSDEFKHYFEHGGNAEKWQPVQPDDSGWFMLSLFETDDGPVCWWTKHKTDHKVLTIGEKKIA